MTQQWNSSAKTQQKLEREDAQETLESIHVNITKLYMKWARFWTAESIDNSWPY